MSVLDAVLIIVATLGFAIVACEVSRAVNARRSVVKYPEITSERPNDLNFGFAIILGFVLVAALGNFQDAREAATTEARALTTMSRSSLGLPAPLRDDLSHQLVCYGRDVVAYDWPAMREGDSSGSPYVSATADRISQTLARAAGTRVVQDAVMASLIDGSSALSESRAQRVSTAQRLPALFWLMIIVGTGLVVSLSAILMAQEYRYLQYLVTGGSALIIAFTIVLIGALDRPYSNQSPLPLVEPIAMRESVASAIAFAPDPAVDRPCP